ncbi:MAG: DNA-directed RNA polymerase subunit M [Candidatus Nitrosocaldaceae archaeon]|nr:MAG: transcription factor S [Candidatus Nitrosothermus koennekii]GIU72602.1 MAG: DNA-directed RNA polymerase subunit M [Candidatus Nitrosocaldaceae archaeon]
MRFCPKCGTRLKNKYDEESKQAVLTCTKCGYAEEGVNKKSEVISRDEPSIKIVGDEGENIETMPTIKIECPKCGHDTAVWWMLQTRSADEPTTQFYRCVKCNHTWRHYS